MTLNPNLKGFGGQIFMSCKKSSPTKGHVGLHWGRTTTRRNTTVWRHCLTLIPSALLTRTTVPLLGWSPHWPHWTSGMCGWAMHLLCIAEVFPLPLTPIGPVFLVSFRWVLQGSTTTTPALLLFPLGPAKRPHAQKGLKALMPLVVQLVVMCCWM